MTGRSFAKYGYVAYTAIRSNLAYVGEVVARALFLCVILYIFLQLWTVTYEETGAKRLAGLTLAQMLWYLAITEAIVLSTPRVAPLVDEDVRTGAVTVYLLRPLSYPLYRMWTAFGERFVRFAINLVVAGGITWAIVGPIPMSAQGLALFALAIPMAFLLDNLANLSIGLAAFWIENTNGLVLVYSRVTMILGGMLLPIELFPAWLERIAIVLPFSSVVYGPARMFVAPDVEFLGALLARQAAAVVVFGALATGVYAFAVRRIHAHGG